LGSQTLDEMHILSTCHPRSSAFSTLGGDASSDPKDLRQSSAKNFCQWPLGGLALVHRSHGRHLCGGDVDVTRGLWCLFFMDLCSKNPVISRGLPGEMAILDDLG